MFFSGTGGIEAHARAAIAARRAERAQSKADRQADAIRDLRREHDRLAICCQALWELARDRWDVSDDELQNKILEVDLRDGAADGKVAQTPVPCPNCKRKNLPKRTLCLYCGAPTSAARPHTFI